ncbi:putative secreted protein (Por secretion system target) [Gelidibacter algens]|uniref:Putative secreted protein (Por secretion system target) n=1 Tax=Gelidibacter algens TaxID=49280 RepID=A0A1A7QZR8_9FLAO|nr:T9SS type A sorting domain-containing protein [Gelidibacter algens]OBX25510.1 hypothetical protein A9996_09385 [Gelidibacter algens]RAJ22236.1 putative secreted protein (Por secretion system target) [Gelidibacter algens]
MKKFYFLLITVIAFNFGYGQDPVIVSIDKANVSVGQSTIIGFADNLSAIGFTRGPGLGNGAPLSATFTANNWNALGDKETAKNANDFIEWSVTADPNFKLKISALRIAANTTLGGPRKWQIFYSVNDFVNEAPLSAVTDLLPYDGDEYPLSSINVTGFNIISDFGGTIKFRLYAWGGSETGENMLAIQQTLLTTDFGITNPGCRIKGSLIYDGIQYSNEQWTPVKPSDETGDQNVYIADGTYDIGKNEYGESVDENVFIKNLVIANGAAVTITPESNLTINENLSVGDNLDNPGNLVLNSTSTRYSSLIVEGTSIGDVTYKRHVNSNAAGNDLISAPVTGQPFSEFVINNDNIRNNNGTVFLFGPFEKVDGTFVNWSDTESTTLNPGTGYRAASIVNGTFTFVGDVNLGTVNQPISNEGTAFQKWNLIGNPYPSYIRFIDFFNQNETAFDDDTAAVYGFDGNSSDGWTILNNNNATELIAPGQGFFVASKPGGGTISFNAAMRSTGTSDDFIPNRTANTNAAYTQLKIHTGAKSYKTELYFNDNSTKALDKGYDAAVFGKNAPSFAIYTQLVDNNTGIDLAVQSLPFEDLTSNVLIPLGINMAKGEQITVSIEKSMLPEGIEVYLEDNVNNTFTLLNTSDYVFTANSKLVGTGRFFLRFTKATLSTSDPNELSGLQLYATDSKVLFVKGLLKENTAVSVYDIHGRLVNNVQLKANSNTNQLDLSQLNTGVYIVKLKNTIQEITQKIMLR